MCVWFGHDLRRTLKRAPSMWSLTGDGTRDKEKELELVHRLVPSGAADQQNSFPKPYRLSSAGRCWAPVAALCFAKNYCSHWLALGWGCIKPVQYFASFGPLWSSLLLLLFLQSESILWRAMGLSFHPVQQRLGGYSRGQWWGSLLESLAGPAGPGPPAALLSASTSSSPMRCPWSQWTAVRGGSCSFPLSLLLSLSHLAVEVLPHCPIVAPPHGGKSLLTFLRQDRVAAWAP